MSKSKAHIPGELIDSLRIGRVHLLIGSGPSVASKLEAWDDLIQAMKVVIEQENTRFSTQELSAFLGKADHLDVADVFRETVKDHRYFQFLRDRYRRDVPLSRLHKALAKLPVKTIFTTNFDKLLEKAFREAQGCDPPVVIYPEQLGYIEEKELRIIKVHGDIDHPSSLVLTRSDYAKYETRHRDFVQAIHNSLNDSTMLFVGFGLRDPNFQRIYNDARSFYDTTKHQAFAVMTGTNEVERNLWANDGLTILPLKDHSQVPGYLIRLQREL